MKTETPRILLTIKKWRFSLRSLIIAVTIICVLGGLVFGPRIRHAVYHGKWERLGAIVDPDATYDSDVTSVTFLQGTSRKALPAEINKLANLRELSISDLEISDFSINPNNHKSLVILEISFAQVVSLSDEINKISTLKKLTLRDQGFSGLPPEVGNFSKHEELTELALRGCSLSKLPIEIGKIRNLRQLDLRDNNFSRYPEELFQLRILSGLYLSNNQLSSLPPEICTRHGLNHLYLTNNRLSSLPKNMGLLRGLLTLGLQNNPITDLDLEALKPLHNLEYLYIQNTKVTQAGVEDLQKAIPTCKITSDYK